MGKEWMHVKYMVFDAPGTGTFEERLELLCSKYPSVTSAHMKSVAHAAAGVYVVDHLRCRSSEHLDQVLDEVLASGGEGYVAAHSLMLREPKSHYKFERSTTLYKLKPTHTDSARVTGYSQGSGQCAGEVGALIVELDGVQFRVGSGLTASLRARPPPVGSIVHVTHGGPTAQGIPRFPRYSGTVHR